MRVWRAQPDCFGSAEWRALACLLDAAEQARAARLRFTADRMAYVLAHGLRRLALAHLLNLPRAGAAALRFGQDAAGRPFLLQIGASGSAVGWFFSHAHAREGVLFAACRQHPIGIDVEPVRRDAPDPGLLRRYLFWPDHRELNWESPRGFAEGWTALEAFVKALGCGLPGLSSVPGIAPVRCTTLSTRNGGRSALRLGLLRSPACQEALVLRPFAPPGCAAALAVRQGRKAPPPRLEERRLEADAALLGRLC